MEKMMKCPFCESTAIFVELRADGVQTKDRPVNLSFSAICNECQARGPIVQVFNYPKSKAPLTEEVGLAIGKDKQQAIDEAARLWNQR